MIRVLGEVRVSRGGLHDPGTRLAVDRKARELVTVLVLHSPAALGFAELADLLWDRPPASAARTIRAHVSRVRAAAEGAGESDPIESARGESYRLSASVRTDVAEVARLRREARDLAAAGRHDVAADRLATARELWPAAPQIPPTLAGQALLLGWESERRGLTADHLAAIVRGSHPDGALAELARITASHPLDEPTWVLYVTALHACGRQVEALDAAARARHALAEMGLDPGPALRQAQAAVLAGPGPPRTADPATVDPPPVRYGERGRTAYRSLSKGHPDLLLLNPGMITLDGLLDDRHVRDACARLARLGRLVTLDRRGIGLSAPLDPATPALDQWVEDIEEVCRHAGLSSPVVVANFDTGLVALEYAARNPDRVAGMVLVNCFARYRRGEGYPYGLGPDQATELVEATVDPSRPRPVDTAALVAPSLAAEPEFRDWWNQIGRRGGAPAVARVVRHVAITSDLRDRLSAVTCPTLVLYRRQCLNLDPGHSRYLAETLVGARSVALDGVDSVWFTDPAPLIEATADFLRSATRPGGPAG